MRVVTYFYYITLHSNVIVTFLRSRVIAVTVCTEDALL